MRRRTVLKSSTLLALSALATATLGSCNQQPADDAASTPTTEGEAGAPLRIALVPWIGWGEVHIAEAKGFFVEEGIEVEQTVFQTVTDVNTALLSGQVDMAWLVASDLVILSESKPDLKFIYASDYSGEVDAIVGRNIAKPADLAGKKLAQEDIPYETVFVAKFLESAGLSAEDVTIVPLAAADGSTALVAGDVDAVATYEPFVGNALKAGDEYTVLFTAAGTNIIINGLAAPASLLSDRRDDVLAYLRALEKANQLIASDPTGTNQLMAKWIGVSEAEATDLLTKVDTFDMAKNKEVAFSDNELNVASSIDAAGEALVAAKKAIKAPLGNDLVDGSLVNEL
jgi:NitT/TauT family transport system substrate-binding protein